MGVLYGTSSQFDVFVEYCGARTPRTGWQSVDDAGAPLADENTQIIVAVHLEVCLSLLFLFNATAT